MNIASSRASFFQMFRELFLLFFFSPFFFLALQINHDFPSERILFGSRVLMAHHRYRGPRRPTKWPPLSSFFFPFFLPLLSLFFDVGKEGCVARKERRIRIRSRPVQEDVPLFPSLLLFPPFPPPPLPHRGLPLYVRRFGRPGVISPGPRGGPFVPGNPLSPPPPPFSPSLFFFLFLRYRGRMDLMCFTTAAPSYLDYRRFGFLPLPPSRYPPSHSLFFLPPPPLF